MNRFLAASLCLVALACPTSSTQTTNPPPAPPPLDEALPAGRARCGLVTRAVETIGGPGAYMEVGRSWRCYNSKVRFGGGMRDGAPGLALYGGALLDADRVRPDETVDGEDQFRESFPAPGFLGVDVKSVTVLASGVDGGDAVIRVEGKSVPLGVLPQIILIQQAYDGDVTTDFILHPDAEYLEITTTVANNEARAISIIMGDFLAMGSGVRAFTPETGFGGAEIFSAVSIYAGASEHVSYAYTVRSGKFTIPVVDAGGTATLVRSDVTISDRESYTRFLAVGSGSLASALAIARDVRGEPQGTLRVHFTQGGQPVAGKVSLFDVAAPGRVANQLQARSDGTAEDRVLQGSYTWKAQGTGTPVASSMAPITITAGMSQELTIALDGMAHVSFHAHEVTSSGADLGPVPAKLSVVALDAPGLDPDLADAQEHGLVTYAVSANGELETQVPAGRYRFIVSRGMEYDLVEREETLVAGMQLNLDAPLHHVLDSTGMVGGEFHQHSLGSLDSPTHLATKVLENAAEGVELAAATDHDNVKDYAPYVAALGLAPFFQGWAGNEISYNGVGHFNAYPLEIDAAQPFKDTGGRLWAGKSVVDLFASLRARPEDPLIHVSHPRSNNGKGYFSQVRLNPISGDVYGQSGSILTMVPEGTFSTLALDFDALEVNNEIAAPDLLENPTELDRLARDQPTGIPTMVDWFHLISTGHHVAALGNSDSHQPNEGSGWPRNFILVAQDSPMGVTREDVKQAVRAQQVLVSNGLLVEPRVAGQVRLGKQDAVVVSGQVELQVRVQSAQWLGGAKTLRIYMGGVPWHGRLENGHLVADAAAPADIPVTSTCTAGLCVLDATLALSPAQDTFVVFAALGAGSSAPVGSGEVYGYTNPVYLDVGGDGFHP